jgi:DNA-binding MarR family transcriptional regulator
LWQLLGSANHAIGSIRQQELNKHRIPIRQFQVLRTIQDLGSKATLVEVAKLVEREVHVISRQTVLMEKDGLIRRNKITPKSNLLKLELTEKGFKMINAGKPSKSIDTIFSFLTEDDRQQMISILNRMIIEAKAMRLPT